MTVRVEVRYFAAVRERLALEGEAVQVDAGSTVEDLWATLVTRHPVLERYRPHLRVAVNGEFSSAGRPLESGDEVALIPPVAGGSEPVRVTREPLDISALARRVRRDSDGAIVSFVGVVRDHNEGHAVSYLEYEAYEAMANQKMAEIAREIAKRWPDCALAAEHRIGRLDIGEPALAIAVASPHRQEAFEACQYLINRIKEDVPIWKREVGPEGAQWVGFEDEQK